jgi:hypothetical protein
VAEALPDVHGEARCRVLLASWSWVGVAGFLGMFDVPFEIVGPTELRDAVATLGDRCRAAVGQP